MKSSWVSECQLRSRSFETFIPVGSRALLGKAKFEYRGLVHSRTTFLKLYLECCRVVS